MINKVVLVGRTTKDIEMKDSTKGYCRFTVAVERNFKKANGEKGVDYIECLAWGKQAEILSKYVRRGNKVALVGRIETGKYQNAEGKTVYTTTVVVEDVQFLEGRKDTEAKAKISDDDPVVNKVAEIFGGTVIDDGLPF